jgi:S1-C subfamily serine protease
VIEQTDQGEHTEQADNDVSGGTTAGATATAAATAASEQPDGWQVPHPGGFGGGAGWGPWGPHPTWGTPPPPPRDHRLRAAGIGVVAAALVAASAGVGFVLGRQGPTTGTAASSTSPANSAGGGAAGSQIASKVDPGVVDVNTQLGYQGGAAAGTGIVLTSSGEVLTNNHVVDGATSISVTDVGNGRTYNATVVGTDATDDVAALKLSGASGLSTVKLGNSSTVSVGDAVVAIGNAGGTGGTPSVSSGTVSALNQSITASDELSNNAEQLSGLIETTATLQPGDSGGPLVNSQGAVVGMDTAASSNFQFQSGSSGSNQNYAIPINSALSVAKQIESGQASSTIHIGPTAFLGVAVQSASDSGGSGSEFGGLGGSAGGFGSSGGGATVEQVESGSPADQAGLSAGDEITSLNGNNINSADDLSSVMERLHPGQTVELGWTDSSGQQHTAQVQLATGPAA